MSQAEAEGPARALREALAVALAVGALHVLLRLSGSFLFGAFDDDGVYVALGKAIAQGVGYRSIYLVGAPLQLRFPPGFPLLLAAPWALGGTLGAVRVTVAVANALAVSGAAGLIWWIGRRQLAIGRWPLAVCALLPLVIAPAILFYNLPLSEPYFVLGWAAALALGFPLIADPGSRGDPGRAAVLGLVLAATTLFRAAAIALLPALLLALWLRRRRADAIVCAAAALAPLAVWAGLRAYWVARSPVSPVPDNLGYWQWLGAAAPVAAVTGAIRAVVANTWSYVDQLATWLFPLRWLGVGVVSIAVLATIAAGVLHRRAHPGLALTVLSVTGLTLMWPYMQGRLVLPILPFAGLLLATGIDRGVRGRAPRLVLGARVTLGVLALAVAGRQFQLRRLANRSFETGVLPRVEDRSPTLILAYRTLLISRLTNWLSRYTTPHDRVMVEAPAGVYLYTGRQTVNARPAESPLVPSVFRVPGRYLAERVLADSLTVVEWSVVDRGLGQDIAAIRSRCPGVLTRAAESPEAPVYYRVHRDDACLRAVAQGGPVRAGS